MSGQPSSAGIRLVVLDDAPHVAWEGRVHAVNATFHQFLAIMLDVDGPDGRPAIARLRMCVPVRPAAEPPAGLPVDPRIEVVATAPFDGIAGFVRGAPALLARNAPRLRRALRDADVTLLRLPASNGLLAAALARALGVPRVAYVAGSVRAVVAGQGRGGPAGLAAQCAAASYDLATRLAAAGADTIVVGADLAGDGIVTSLVRPGEVRSVPAAAPWPAEAGRLRLAWSGRLARGKGLETLLDAVALLAADPPGGRRVELCILGDGPARPALEARAAEPALAGRVAFSGYVADRDAYLASLAAADLFLFPSPAEGFPKVVLDAMAAGLPVMAAPAGTLAELIGAQDPGRPAPLAPVAAGDPPAIAAAVRALVADPGRAMAIRTAGTRFVLDHTADAEASRLVARLVAAAGRH